MSNQEEPDVIVDNGQSEPEESTSVSQVVVDLEKKPEEKQEPKQEVKSSPSTPEISKLNNTIAYQTRKLEQAMRELQEMREQLSSRPKQTVQQQNTVIDPIDEVAQRDWKQGVRQLVDPEIEAKIQAAFDKREQAQRELLRKQSLESELDKSKRRVLDKYPEIDDDSSEASSLYRQVINEDQTILSNIHGPEIAMYRMEERMRQMGKTPSSAKPFVDREVSRLARAGASNVSGRQASPNGKITLSKDQKEFCDHHSIPYEQYAKNLKANADRGVEI